MEKVGQHGIGTLYAGCAATWLASFVGGYPWFVTFNGLDARIPQPPPGAVGLTCLIALRPAEAAGKLRTTPGDGLPCCIVSGAGEPGADGVYYTLDRAWWQSPVAPHFARAADPDWTLAVAPSGKWTLASLASAVFENVLAARQEVEFALQA